MVIRGTWVHTRLLVCAGVHLRPVHRHIPQWDIGEERLQGGCRATPPASSRLQRHSPATFCLLTYTILAPWWKNGAARGGRRRYYTALNIAHTTCYHSATIFWRRPYLCLYITSPLTRYANYLRAGGTYTSGERRVLSVAIPLPYYLPGGSRRQHHTHTARVHRATSLVL